MDTPKAGIPKNPNPYVGPRAFRYGETLYGRTQETMALLDLLIAERLVKFYAPSGAGKSSLIEAGLRPQLIAEGFNVLPIMRVNQEPEMDFPVPHTFNRYIFSLLQSLEKNLAPEQQRSPAELAALDLETYLTGRETETDETDGTVLIFDQFEEILTLDPTNRAAKTAFFDQVGQVLRNPDRWAIFSLREDYIAGLDPYLRPIPTRLNTSFRLQLLDPTAAREAMQGPAEKRGVPFTDQAADKLITDLRQVRVQQQDGQIIDQPGHYIEPVQLQVVCNRLWTRKFSAIGEIDETIPQGTQIEAADIESAGDVDSALAGYYADQVNQIAAQKTISERIIRDWCHTALITPQGIRGQVMRSPRWSQGLDNRAIEALVDSHLVRAEDRRGVTWYELAHDRLIKPVRNNNLAWMETNLNTLQRQAALWDTQGQPDSLLLNDTDLEAVEQWAEDHRNELTRTERIFLAKCRQVRHLRLAAQQTQAAEARAEEQAKIAEIETLRAEEQALAAQEQALAAEEQARLAKRMGLLALRVGLVGTIAILLALMAGWFGVKSSQNAARANTESTRAIEQQQTAQAESTYAAQQKAAAEAASTLAVEQARIAEDGQRAAEIARIIEIQQRNIAEEKQQTAEAASTLAVKKRQEAEAGWNNVNLALAVADQQRATAEAASALAVAQQQAAETKQAELANERAVLVEQLQDLLAQATTEAESEIVQSQLAALRVTQTAAAQPTATPTVTPTPIASPISLDFVISDGRDDAEERLDSGNMYLISSDLEMAFDTDTTNDEPDPRGPQQVGLRFQNVTIPRQAQIKTAYIVFSVDEKTDSRPVSLIVFGQADDNAATFSDQPGDLSNRARTSPILWEPSPWNTAYQTMQTPDLAKTVQEIISRDGWTSGNALAFFITSAATEAGHVQEILAQEGVRTAISSEVGSETAPRLHIEFLAEVSDIQMAIVIPTPTPTPTPTPIPTATATPTPTAIATLTPTPTPLPIISCPFEPQDEFSILWDEYKGTLGCPKEPEPIGGLMAEQPFEKGYMYWLEISDLFIIFIGDQEGDWIMQNRVEAYNPSGASCPPPVAPTAGLEQPIRGFGGVWCEKDLYETIGFATDPEHGVNNNRFQVFDKGAILRDGDLGGNHVDYILFNESNRYIRVEN